MLKKLGSSEQPAARVPASVTAWLAQCRTSSQSFWDRASGLRDVERTECDFDHVAEELVAAQPLAGGDCFVEWGCGLATITGVAALLGMRAIGLEIEAQLCVAARRQLARRGLPAEVINDNFLPSGAHELADSEDPVVSLKFASPNSPVPTSADMALQAANIVYVYSWPNEEHFLKLVFDRFAKAGTLLLLYRGPEQLEVYRKH